MKHNSLTMLASALRLTPSRPLRTWWLAAQLIILGATSGRAAELQVIHTRTAALVTNLAPIRQSSRWDRLNLSLSLPLRDRGGLTNLLQELYDPASTNYHRFLTPEQFAERFGPTEQDYETVVAFARSNGLAVTARHSNRAVVSVRGTVAAVERALHVTMNEYQHPTESRTFFAPDREPSVALPVPLLAVGGLDNFVLPRPCLKPLATPQAGANLTGSGPNGGYLGNDFRAAYVPGVPQTGAGQTVGLLEFDSGFYQSDITAYEALAGLTNVPVSAVLLDGYNGGAGIGNDEVSLDIEMAISMAPGLKGVLVYEGSTTDDILNRMATDDVAKQIGASWTYGIDAGSEQAFLQFAAQGQSFFNASGDSDAYTGAVPTPADDPNIIVVGGTTLTTTGPGGPWAAETVWNWGGGTGGSGGISTVVPIPVWQQGINMTTNQGSTTKRNLPDVAMTADNVYVKYGNGQGGAFGGTSCATPLWAGFIALVNQLALTNGEPTVGFVNPVVYGMGRGSNSLSYTALFHDIATGNNESPGSPARFSAVPGYDLCTGWGTPVGSNLVTALALPEALRISPGGDVIITGPVGGPFSPATQTYSLTNNGSTPLNWALGSTSTWFNVAPLGGTLVRGNAGTTVAIGWNPSDTNLSAGSYSAALRFTNLNDNFVQTRHAILAVVTPPAITVQPANQAVLVGTTANFSVSNAANALMFYQWQENGTNLSDGGKISGSATSALTISNVTTNNIGAYSVVLSNAAGVLASSNAALTIVPSPPVIVWQPTNQVVLPGAPASFSVAVVGNTPYLYQWQFAGTSLTNGANYFGVTNSTLVVSNVTAASAGVYSVVVSNPLGSVASTGAVLSVISVTAPGVAMATVWSFAGGNSGAYLYSPLMQARDGNFYGTTIEGGAEGEGTVFKLATNGTLTTLFSFDGADGAFPYGGLFQGRDNFLYGTVYAGFTYGDGGTFKVNTSGGFTTLNTWNGNNGMLPVSGMIQGADGYFYGTTLEGGAYGLGTVFRQTTGGGLATLVSFDSKDGANPSPVLVQATDGNFYGTTEDGGTHGEGTVFQMTPSGRLTTLYSFSGGVDGAVPIAGLVQAVDGNLYGVTYLGGQSGSGTVFKITTAGAFAVLYSFTGGSDGAYPWGGLVQARDGNLYGTTQSGGAYDFGTVFQIAPDGPLTTLAQFEGYNGANPSAAMIQAADGNLYGTTETGGATGNGAIFRIGINGPLQITGEPADQPVYLGGTAVFTVATSGAGPVSYQWEQDGVNLVDGGNLTGSATATLRITNVTVADAALYSVVVSNAFNSVASDYADLEIVYSPPHITGQPVSQTCVVGMTATFSVAAGGDQPLAYQWQENGTNLNDGGNLSGSATSTLTLAGVATANSGVYSVIVSNALFSVASGNAVLTVVPGTSSSAALTELRQLAGANDGAFPYGGLMLGKDGNLYGTAAGGGGHYDGTIFRMSLAGILSTVYAFTGGTSGADPYARLVQGGNGNFYGPTSAGGANGYGTLFSMTTGSAVSFLYSFSGGADGEYPQTGLTPGTAGNFYGTSYQGGANALGCVYQLNTNGSVTPVYEFTGGSDGEYPYSDLVLGRDGQLYGTTEAGGAGGYGTLFRLATNGTFTTLVAFNYTNGAYPEGGLVQGNDGNFYGTTFEGGLYGYGTVFQLTTNGALSTLHSFANADGSGPAADLVQGADGNFYGTCSAGGAGGQGTAFRITTNGALSTLVWFDGLNGASPQSAMVQAPNGSFYGTTPFGGIGYNPSAGGGNGTIFRLIVPSFITSPFTGTYAIACLPYSGGLASKAVAPTGDGLTFAKVSGPVWLNVATNGALSGTPTNSDIGTNVFVVSVTDTNGVSASATMDLVVIADPAPAFFTNPFDEPWANVEEEYYGSIATNGTAPFLGDGDILSFARVSGPAWLNVAVDGTLSGVPDGINAGTNSFVVSVTDLGGASNTATLMIYVNSAPQFEPENFSGPPALAGVAYAGTTATNVIDPDLGAGDGLTFYKVTGAAWLNVATNGILSGTPGSGDVGAESFLVLVVDSGGLAGIGNLTILVNPNNGPLLLNNPVTMALTKQGRNLLLNWSGGVPPYQVQFCTNPASSGWQNLGAASDTTNLMVSPTNAGMFYRVQGQ